MKISLNWIKKYVDIPAKLSASQIAELLTLRTCEVEGYEDEKLKFANMVVGKTLKLQPHPNADKLRLADTDIGGKTVQVVCGGKNLREGMMVAVALPGAVVNWHGTGETLELKETKIRGEQSHGMICAGEEIGLPPSPLECITDLSELFAGLNLPTPKIGTTLAEALGKDDVVFEIDNKSLTHRPDLWGHYGMAREFSVFLGKKLRKLAPKVTFPKNGQKIKIDVAKPQILSRFLSAIITGVKIEGSPRWLKQQLNAVGVRPVNNIVDITNYAMLELGHPMHAFDRQRLASGHFVIRFAKAGETITTIDHKTYKLSGEDALVTNGETPLAIAGIMGGAASEINLNTTEIVLEVGTWNPVMIRKTAQRHALRTDAAQRFEKSLDPETSELAFKRACELILQICKGAKLAGPASDFYPKKAPQASVLLETAKVCGKIGATISEKEMTTHLKALEFGVSKAKKGVLKVTVPSFRATKDINIEDDLIEEIARMHGYEKITPVLPLLPIRLPVENHERTLKHKARQILSLALGFTETSLYSFYGAQEIKKCLLPDSAHVRLDNPLTEDQACLRISLLPNMLKAAAMNLNQRDSLKMYEIGHTYIKERFFPREEKFICGVIARPQNKMEVFYDTLGLLQTFLKQFGQKAYVEEGLNPPPYSHPSKFAIVKAGREEIAAIYEVHPQVLKNLGIEMPMSAFEINFSRLAAIPVCEKSYKSLPRFPGIEIDISVLVQKRTPVREIIELIRNAGQQLIAGISLIDIFENKSLGEGKKSFTVRVLLQSPDRTLTDTEMKEIQGRIFKTLTDSGFTIRGL